MNRHHKIPLIAPLILIGALVAPRDAMATFSGDAGRISFARFLEDKDGPGLGGLEVFSAKPDGSDETRLTLSNDGRTSFFNDWSPDGNLIAFDSDRIDQDGRDDVVQIYVTPWNGESGGPAIQLTVGPGFHGDPAWSPDGTWIAIESDWNDYPAQQGIWLVPSSDPDGVTIDEATRVTAIPAGMNFDSEPQFSPDGQWLAFVRYKSCRFQPHGNLAFNPSGCTQAVYRVRVDGSGLERLTPWGALNSAPDWSPNGTRIAFDSCDTGRIGCKGDVYVMNADGSQRTRITNNPTVVGVQHQLSAFRFEFGNNPVWSPDGTRILYTQWTEGSLTQLVAIDPDGSDRQVIVDGDFFQNKADWGTHS